MMDRQDAVENLRDGLRGAKDGLKSFGRMLTEVASISSRFVKETTRASYNTLGEYTFPFEQEVLGTTPPSLSELNPYGRAALFGLGVIPVSWILSLTAIPLVGNSLQSLPRAFVDTANLALDPEDAIPNHRTLDRGVLRQAYGTPGFVLGAVVGGPFATLIGMGRIVSNSAISSAISFSYITNFALTTNDQLKLGDENRTASRQIMGAPGLVLGGFVGVFGFAAIGLGRMITNSVTSFGRSFVFLTNGALASDNHIKMDEDKRTWARQVLGMPGFALGAIGGLLGFAAVSLARIISNSGISFGRSFMAFTNGALGKEDKVKLNQDTRSGMRIAMGAPGSVVGAAFGLLGFAAVGFGRIVTNSAISLADSFITITNAALAEEDALSELNARRSILRSILGLPGSFVGAAFGLVGFMGVTLGRILANSANSLLRRFVTVTNLALDPTVEIKLTTDTRNTLSTVMGLPGLVLGSLAGVVGFGAVGLCRIIGNSAMSFKKAFTSLTNAALDPKDECKVVADSRAFRRQAMGLPGLVLGGFTGLFGFAAIGFGRSINNSVISFIHVFKTMSNTALEDNYAFKTEDKRSLPRKWLGAPGFLMGGVIGVFGFAFAGLTRLFRNASITTARVFKTITNVVLDPEDQFQETEDSRNNLGKGLGLPGYITGAVSGVLGMVAIGFGRIITNSLESFVQGVVAVTNGALDSNDAIPFEDERNTIRTVLGLPGLMIGGLLGSISFTAAGLSRMVSNSIRSFDQSFVILTNTALDPHDKIKRFDDKRNTTRLALGLPGTVLGGVSGLFGFAAVALGRVLCNSAISFGQSFSAVTNAALATEDAISLAEEKRTTLRQGLGIPGFAFGAIAGVIGFAAVGAARILSNSAISFARGFSTFTNGALDTSDAIKLSNDKRNLARKIMGAPGLLLGSIAGLFGFTAVGLGRIVSNSGLSFVTGFCRVTNAALASENTLKLAEDKRHTARVVMGLPGLVLGGIFGAVGFAAVGVGRLFIHNADSFGRGFADTSNAALDPEDALRLTEDKRERHQKIMGGLGFLVGAGVGLIGFALLGAVRVLTNSHITALRVFKRMTNIVLASEDQFLVSPDNRSSLRKGLGMPGVVIGGLMGVMGMSAVAIGRFVIQTFTSFVALSGSFMNGALGRSLFAGLAGDRRSASQKAVGGLGYALSVVTTLPVAATIWTLKEIPLTLFAAVAGIAISPLMALAKWCKKPRFVEPEPGAPEDDKFKNQDDITQGFKNIYSSLTWQGRLKPGAVIQSHANGSESGMSFFRKSITFNGDSITEKTLHMLLKAYREFEKNDEGGIGAQFFSGAQFDEAVKAVKDRVLENECVFIPAPEEIASKFKQIDNVAEFVKNYMLNHINKPAPIRVDLYPEAPSYFWGVNNSGEMSPPSAPSPRFFVASKANPSNVVTSPKSGAFFTGLKKEEEGEVANDPIPSETDFLIQSVR